MCSVECSADYSVSLETWNCQALCVVSDLRGMPLVPDQLTFLYFLVVHKKSFFTLRVLK